MTTIILRPITPDNWVEKDLAPTDEQKRAGYVAANVLSLAQAYAERWWTPLSVYADETMVGFVLYGRWPERGFSTALWGDTPKPGIDYILRMMIDQRYQGQGYGKAALTALVERIKSQPDCQAIELDYDRENVAAAHLYAGFGFQPVAEDADGEILARLVVNSGYR